ncbi:helix-turn-helix domain-containing protein [Chondromyces apiculatus]|uniref:helix-turn-helix domain-containing protein n=1 Tax=Chondromyces apiculatus TaxID=51 RepID=UPI0005C4FB7C|nr:helix-turn-helix transcriptional regulator [Chondromyces apiculatus]
MDGEQIKALRQKLGCTARELAMALGLEQETVLAWERGEIFPTKRYVARLEEIQLAGPSAIPRVPKRRRERPSSPLQALAEPETWQLLRKLLAHAELREQVMRLAEPYPDPAGGLPDDSS